MDQVIGLLGAFGIGSLVTTVVQARLARKDRIDFRKFEEKKEAYIGLLEALHRAATERGDEVSKNFAYWQLRCDLVGSEEVRDAVQGMIDTNENGEERSRVFLMLKDSLRKDLGITV